MPSWKLKKWRNFRSNTFCTPEIASLEPQLSHFCGKLTNTLHLSFKFKALELNKKILESAEELKKPPVKDSTVPDGFELQIEKRLQERQATKKPQEDDEVVQFKSRPLPKKILEGVVVSDSNTGLEWVGFCECSKEDFVFNRDCQKRKFYLQPYRSHQPLP